MAKLVSQKELTDRFSYDPTSGFFTRISGRGRRGENSRAGYNKGNGYRCIEIGNFRYYEHRLAWLYINGSWPPDQIDHINGDPSDNRIANLRLATNEENSQSRAVHKNNKTGFTGVHYRKSEGIYLAKIRWGGETYHLGCFSNPREAYGAYLKAKLENHKFQPELRENHYEGTKIIR